MNEMIIFFKKLIPLLLKGAVVSVEITVLSVLLGMGIGLVVAFSRIYGGKWLKKIVYIYEWVLRGTPILVIIFIIYYGFPRLGMNFGPFLSVVLGLGLRSSAYQAQIYRGAILSIGTEQMEAALSLGMKKVQAMKEVIFPQAIRLSLPGFTNEFTIVLKDSPLAYLVGIAEMLKYGREVIVTTFKPFTVYLTVAIFYFILFELFYYLFKQVAKFYEVPGFIVK